MEKIKQQLSKLFRKNTAKAEQPLRALYQQIRTKGKEPLPIIKIGCCEAHYGAEADEASREFNFLMWSAFHRAPKLTRLLLWLKLL